MLKIKDNVDLKILEKFGFYHLPARDKWQYGKDDWYVEVYEEDDREIWISSFSDDWCRINDIAGFLFDLISVGIVEKVGG